MTELRALWEPHKKPPECAGCPYAQKGRGFVPGVGDLREPLIFAVFEKPGENEVNDGIPLVGRTGKIVERSFVSWDRVYRTNVRKCLAWDKGKTTEAKAERARATAHCARAYLQREVEVIERLGTATTVVLGGADAARAFFGKVDMQRYHSTVWTREEVDAIRRIHVEGGATVHADDGAQTTPPKADAVVPTVVPCAEDPV